MSSYEKEQERRREHLRDITESAAGEEARMRMMRTGASIDILMHLVPYTQEELASPPVITERPVEQAPVYNQFEADEMAHQARRAARNAEMPDDQIHPTDNQLGDWDNAVAADEAAFNQIAQANPDIYAGDPNVASAQQSVDAAFQQQVPPVPDQWREMTNA